MAKISFWAKKEIREPVVVKFRRSDGSVVNFEATKIVKEPVKVTFFARKKK